MARDGSWPRSRHVLAIALWKSYGGAVYWPELGTVFVGHFLNAGLTIALAAATASVAEHPATAAILTLSVTVGTWIVNFVAAVHGGFWEVLARFTPTAMVAEFQRGLVRLDVVLVALVLVAAGLGLAAIWMRLGVAERRRVYESLALGAGRGCRDRRQRRGARQLGYVGEPRELVLASRRTGARAHPRSAARSTCTSRRKIRAASDLERRALSKLRRVMPGVDVRYVVRDLDRALRADRARGTAKSGTTSAGAGR